MALSISNLEEVRSFLDEVEKLLARDVPFSPKEFEKIHQGFAQVLRYFEQPNRQKE